MADYNPLEFGRQLHEYRLRLGWSARQLAELYAEFVGRANSPPSTAFIYQVEKGTTMLDLERRAILASLVGMPLALAGIHIEQAPKYVDTTEYTEALDLYYNSWRAGTIQQSATAIRERTSRLEVVSFQTFGADKKALVELLIYYQLLSANLWSDSDNKARAYYTFSATIELARQENLSTLLVHTLAARSEMVQGNFEKTHDVSTIKSAHDDCLMADQYKRNLPGFHLGLMQVRKGLLDAYVAGDGGEFLNALNTLEVGSKHIASSPEDGRILTRLDYERYMIQRAAAYLYSPLGTPILAIAVLDELNRYQPEPKWKRRSVTRNRLFAEAYLAVGNYPMAAAHLEAAVDDSIEGNVADLDGRLTDLLRKLQNTSFRTDGQLGRIAFKLNKLKYPEIFH
jgi:hypothetical protein